ncbi:uncharacterized protein LOC132062081 [Lycium ferocissimum]|uniref:uncharacterized protein LOC132062081 n=1 Tax=Lycium ferocissimum TaxID=112874 RepID=UPI0028161C6F|nr:uncharacterized protein LOC132062081 [Lycium ferocissimum]
MDRAKMRRGLVMLTFMVICTHRPATAQEELASEPKSCMKFLSCVKNPKSSCITECCNSFNFKATAVTRCNCWRSAVRTDKQALTALQNYCAVDPPPCSVPHPLQEVAETREAIDNKLSGSKQQVEKVATCCAKD